MDWPLLIPFAPFLMVLGIVWIRTHASLEEKRIAARAALPNEAGESVAVERIVELEERVRVLERIVTDGGYDLAHKIEALRDERLLETRHRATVLEEKI